MSKTHKVLFSKAFNSSKDLDNKRVGKPVGDNDKPSFTKSMLTNIVGVELNEIAKSDKFESDRRKKKTAQVPEPPIICTNDPHELVQTRNGQHVVSRVNDPAELRSRDSVASSTDHDGQQLERGMPRAH